MLDEGIMSMKEWGQLLDSRTGAEFAGDAKREFDMDPLFIS